METKGFLKSKVNRINIIGLLILILGENIEVLNELLQFIPIPAKIGAFIIFVLNVIVQKFSKIPVVQTGVSIDWLFYVSNGLGALVMILGYFQNDNLFNIPPHIVVGGIMFINLILRTFFTNQYKPVNQ